MKKIKWYHIVLFIFILIGIIGAINFGFQSPNNNISFWNDSKLTSLTDWSFVDSKGKETPISLPVKLDLSANEIVEIHTLLPNNISDSAALCFKTKHCFVEVYAGEALIYSFGNESDIPFGKTPGSIWNVVDIDSKYNNLPITIKLICPYEKYSGNIDSIYYSSQGKITSFVLRQCLPVAISSLIPFILGFLIFFLSPIVYKESETILFQTLGILLLVIALGGLTESGILQFYFGNAYIIQMIGFLTFAILPLITITTIWESGAIKNKALFFSLFIINSLAFLIVILLQILNIADFSETLFIIHLSIGVNIFGYIIDFTNNLKNHTNEKSFVYEISAFIIIFACSVIDLCQFYILDNFDCGSFYRYGILLFILMICLWIIKKSLKLHYDNLEKSSYKEIANTDELTGLQNRRALNELLNKMEAGKEKTFIIFIDLNHLKLINDKKGHSFGDKYIVISAELIRDFGKRSASCFRIGGDEFCIIGSDLNSDYIEKVCNNINIKLALQEEIFGIPLSMSYGYSYYDPDINVNIFHSLSEADKNMYQNKNKSNQI